MPLPRPDGLPANPKAALEQGQVEVATTIRSSQDTIRDTSANRKSMPVIIEIPPHMSRTSSEATPRVSSGVWNQSSDLAKWNAESKSMYPPTSPEMYLVESFGQIPEPVVEKTKTWKMITNPEQPVGEARIMNPKQPNLRQITSYFGDSDEDEGGHRNAEKLGERVSLKKSSVTESARARSIPLLTKPSIMSMAATDSSAGDDSYKLGMESAMFDAEQLSPIQKSQDPNKTDTINQFWREMYLNQSNQGSVTGFAEQSLNSQDVSTDSFYTAHSASLDKRTGTNQIAMNAHVQPPDFPEQGSVVSERAPTLPRVSLYEDGPVDLEPPAKARPVSVQLPLNVPFSTPVAVPAVVPESIERMENVQPENDSASYASSRRSSVAGPREMPTEWQRGVQIDYEDEPLEKSQTLKEALKNAFNRANQMLKLNKTLDISQNLDASIDFSANLTSAGTMEKSRAPNGPRPNPHN